MGAHCLDNALGLGAPVLPQHVRPRGAQVGNALEHLVGRLGTKLRERGQPAIPGGQLQLEERVHVQVLVNGADARRPQPRDAQHLHQPFRRFLLQALQHGGAVAFRQIAQHVESLAIEGDDLIGHAGHHLAHVTFTVTGDCARRALHSPHDVAVPIVQLEQHGDLGKGLRGVTAVHACNLATVWRAR